MYYKVTAKYENMITDNRIFDRIQTVGEHTIAEVDLAISAQIPDVVDTIISNDYDKNLIAIETGVVGGL